MAQGISPTARCPHNEVTAVLLGDAWTAKCNSCRQPFDVVWTGRDEVEYSHDPDMGPLNGLEMIRSRNSPTEKSRGGHTLPE